ncbi:MAG TPA: hypothetical protein DCZ03_00500 [Gammaproteobacteria bacterium]|nr:hypothetical protein [Gammaproteobacteria bacterium]
MTRTQFILFLSSLIVVLALAMGNLELKNFTYLGQNSPNMEEIEIAAKGGDADAQFQLGEHFRKLEQFADARDWYRTAAANQNKDAIFALGLMAWDGLGELQDPIKAVGWFQQAAKLDHAQAMLYLGKAHEKGIGTHRDQVIAFNWVEKAAQTGLAEAQY